MMMTGAQVFFSRSSFRVVLTAARVLKVSACLAARRDLKASSMAETGVEPTGAAGISEMSMPAGASGAGVPAPVSRPCGAAWTKEERRREERRAVSGMKTIVTSNHLRKGKTVGYNERLES